MGTEARSTRRCRSRCHCRTRPRRREGRSQAGLHKPAVEDPESASQVTRFQAPALRSTPPRTPPENWANGLRSSIAHINCARWLSIGYCCFMPRPSPVTDAVRGLLTAGDRHAWSIEELHQSAVAEVGGADYSTVFRAIVGLERQGLVDRVDLGDGRVRFEVPDRHHEHVRCDSCGEVAEIPGCLVEDAVERVRGVTGYVVTTHQIVFSGVCPRCSERNDSPP